MSSLQATASHQLDRSLAKHSERFSAASAGHSGPSAPGQTNKAQQICDVLESAPAGNTRLTPRNIDDILTHAAPNQVNADTFARACKSPTTRKHNVDVATLGLTYPWRHLQRSSDLGSKLKWTAVAGASAVAVGVCYGAVVPGYFLGALSLVHPAGKKSPNPVPMRTRSQVGVQEDTYARATADIQDLFVTPNLPQRYLSQSRIGTTRGQAEDSIRYATETLNGLKNEVATHPEERIRKSKLIAKNIRRAEQAISKFERKEVSHWNDTLRAALHKAGQVGQLFRALSDDWNADLKIGSLNQEGARQIIDKGRQILGDLTQSSDGTQRKWSAPEREVVQGATSAINRFERQVNRSTRRP